MRGRLDSAWWLLEWLLCLLSKRLIKQSDDGKTGLTVL
jgi:hypothetical protein